MAIQARNAESLDGGVQPAGSFVKDNVWVGAGHALLYLKSLVLMPILIRGVGVTLYGSYALLTGAIGFVFGISSFGVNFRYQRLMPAAADRARRSDLFYFQFLFQVASLTVLCGGLALGNNILEAYLFKGEVRYSVWWVVATLAATFVMSQTADYFRFTGRMRPFTVIFSLNPYLTIAFVVWFVFGLRLASLDSLLAAGAIAMALVALPFVAVIVREIGFALPRFARDRLLGDARFGFPLALSYVMDFLLNGSDRYVIAALMSATAVGYYNPGYTLGSLIIAVPKVLSIVLHPRLCRAVDEGRAHEASALIGASMRLHLGVAIPFVVGSYVLAPLLLRIIANQEVAQAAWVVTPIVAGGMLFYGMNVVLTSVLFVESRTKLIFAVNAAAALLNLVATIVLVYLFRSIVMGAVTTLLGFGVAFVILEAKAGARRQGAYNVAFFVKAVAASLVMGAILRGAVQATGHSPAVALVLVPIGAATYVLALFLMGGVTHAQVSLLRRVIGR